MASREESAKPAREPPPVTPDGRYVVVRGRLWRCSDPRLSPDERARLVGDLMDARRAVGTAKRRADTAAEAEARAAVDRAKRGLGERGPVWWEDGSDELDRRMARDTAYAGWFTTLASEAHMDGAVPNESAGSAVPGRGPVVGPSE